MKKNSIKNKLIMIEGVPGSGKTTTAKKISKKLLSEKYTYRLFLEGNLNHPADYEKVAVFNNKSYNKLLNDYKHLNKEIKKYSKKENNNYYVSYGKLLNSKFDFDKNMKKILFSKDVYNLPLDKFKKNCKLKWQKFSENQNNNYIFECCFLQNPTTTMLALHNCSKDQIEKYIKEIEKIILDLNPIIIYLNKKNINRSFDLIKKQRSNKWYNFVLNYVTNQEYGKQNDLEGYEGLLKFYKDLNKFQLQLLSKLSIKNIIINDPHKDWKKTYKMILDNIN
ncbi:MAG: hypothetical protein ACQEQE_07445 [Bacillota bacterium]